MTRTNQPWKEAHAPALSKLIERLAERYQPLQIYSFGYVSTVRRMEGCFRKASVDGEHQHFLFLVKEDNQNISHDVQEFASAHYRHGVVTMICAGTERIQDQTHQSNSFYRTLMNEGTLLYSRDGMAFAEPFPENEPEDPLVTTENALLKADSYVQHRLPIAESFLNAGHPALLDIQPKIRVFFLHQCVEQCTILLIQLFTGHRSDLHSLKRQLQLCNCFSTLPYRHFLPGDAENERLFDILVKSYSSARYKDRFEVSNADAKALYTRVESFYNLTERMCQEQIAILREELDLMKTEKEE
jgi:hypothetical protein